MIEINIWIFLTLVVFACIGIAETLAAIKQSIQYYKDFRS